MSTSEAKLELFKQANSELVNIGRLLSYSNDIRFVDKDKIDIFGNFSSIEIKIVPKKPTTPNVIVSSTSVPTVTTSVQTQQIDENLIIDPPVLPPPAKKPRKNAKKPKPPKPAKLPKPTKPPKPPKKLPKYKDPEQNPLPKSPKNSHLKINTKLAKKLNLPRISSLDTPTAIDPPENLFNFDISNTISNTEASSEIFDLKNALKNGNSEMAANKILNLLNPVFQSNNAASNNNSISNNTNSVNDSLNPASKIENSSSKLSLPATPNLRIESNSSNFGSSSNEENMKTPTFQIEVATQENLNKTTSGDSVLSLTTEEDDSMVKFRKILENLNSVSDSTIQLNPEIQPESSKPKREFEPEVNPPKKKKPKSSVKKISKEGLLSKQQAKIVKLKSKRSKHLDTLVELAEIYQESSTKLDSNSEEPMAEFSSEISACSSGGNIVNPTLEHMKEYLSSSKPKLDMTPAKNLNYEMNLKKKYKKYGVEDDPEYLAKKRRREEQIHYKSCYGWGLKKIFLDYGIGQKFGLSTFSNTERSTPNPLLTT